MKSAASAILECKSWRTKLEASNTFDPENTVNLKPVLNYIEDQ